jgi:hypothetical protein
VKRGWDAAEKKNTLSMSGKDGFLQQNWRMVVVYSYGACDEVAGASLSICCCWQALRLVGATPGHSELTMEVSIFGSIYELGICLFCIYTCDVLGHY